jgi:hypothetical protein
MRRDTSLWPSRLSRLLFKVIEPRNKIEQGMFMAALTLAILPIIGLVSGTAISMGLHGVNYQEATLQDNPSQYWFLIKIELAVVFSMLFLSKFRFPLIESAYQRVLNFKEGHKIVFFMIFYLAIPIVVVACILLLLTLFG